MLSSNTDLSSPRRVMLCAAAMLLVHGVAAGPFVMGGTGGSFSIPGEAAVGASVLLLAALVALATIDWLTFRLPDALTLPLAIAGFIVHWESGQPALLERLIAAAAGFALLAGAAWGYQRLRGRAGMGLGDAKLFAAGGAWLGLAGLPSVLVFATFGALAAILIGVAAGRRIDRSSRLPFGPFLAVAIWIVWLYGPIGDALGF